MKNLVVIVFTFITLGICSFTVLAQTIETDSLKIDSLEKILLHQSDDTNKVNTLNELSRSLLNGRNVDVAIQNAVKALELSNKINFKKGQGNAFLLIANTHYLNNDYSSAIRSGLQALKIREDLRDIRGRATVHRLLNASFGMQGNYTENLKHAFASLKLWEEIGDKKQVASMFADLANIYISHDNYVEGYKYARLGLEASRKEGFKETVTYCLMKWL